MTYSIIAKDAHTGQMGVAVQTCNLAVGTWVPWGIGGVGVVATQALSERSYGTRGLEMMQSGMSAPEVLQELLAVDTKREVRQVSMLDIAGNVATHTGACCIPEAGSLAGNGFCVQANMMEKNTVWQAMAEIYQSTQGGLANRLIAALHAAEAEGGDLRGRQSAALLVVGSQPSAIPLIDLRVDYADDPVGELDRLLDLHQAHSSYYQILNCIDQGDLSSIYDLIQTISELAPDEPYLQYLCGIILDRHLGRREEALSLLTRLVEQDAIWHEYLKREQQTGREPACQGLDASLVAALDERLGQQETGKQDG